MSLTMGLLPSYQKKYSSVCSTESILGYVAIAFSLCNNVVVLYYGKLNGKWMVE